MNRNRSFYFPLILIVIVLGIIARDNMAPHGIHPYLGDTLYGLMWFLVFGFLFKDIAPWKAFVMGMLACYTIEALQLYDSPFLDYIKTYEIGALLLGFTFSWSDIMSYTLGGILGITAEYHYLKKLSQKTTLATVKNHRD